MFFVAVLPQFLAPDDNALTATLILAIVDALLSFCALATYGVVATAAAGLLRRPAARRTADRITGAILIAVGGRIALESR